MTTKSIILFFFIYCFSLSCKNEFNLSNERHKHLIKKVNSLGLSELNIEGRWNMYCLYADKMVNFLDTNYPRNLTFGQAELLIDTFFLRHDTFEVNYHFVYQDTLELYDRSIVKNPITTWGVVYSVITKKRIAYSGRTSIRYFGSESVDSNYLNFAIDSLIQRKHDCSDLIQLRKRSFPLQPETISFIKERRNELNPWFRSEAIRRGILK